MEDMSEQEGDLRRTLMLIATLLKPLTKRGVAHNRNFLCEMALIIVRPCAETHSSKGGDRMSFHDPLVISFVQYLLKFGQSLFSPKTGPKVVIYKWVRYPHRRHNRPRFRRLG